MDFNKVGYVPASGTTTWISLTPADFSWSRLDGVNEETDPPTAIRMCFGGGGGRDVTIETVVLTIVVFVLFTIGFAG
jgi:hypothetical protein